jgi:HSP20 family protein
MFLYSAARDKEWQPAVDIYRTRTGWILKFDLAGVRTEDVQVHVRQRTVTIGGVRRDYMVEEGCTHYSMEITYSRFQRTIELPDDLNSANILLDYRDGILFVRIRIAEEEGNTK